MSDVDNVDDEIKRLEGWFTFKEAGVILGISRPGFHALVFDGTVRPFTTDDLRWVGTILIVREEAVLAEARRRGITVTR